MNQTVLFSDIKKKSICVKHNSATQKKVSAAEEKKLAIIAATRAANGEMIRTKYKQLDKKDRLSATPE